MKYLVIELVNPKVDACAHHESGVATVSDGGDFWGVPLVFTKSGLLNSRNEAKEIAEMLCKKQYEDLEESVYKHSGWFISLNIVGAIKSRRSFSLCSNVKGAKALCCMFKPYTLFLCKNINEVEISEEWLYSYDILEIEE